MSKKRGKPSRKDLLVVIGRLQYLFGCASAALNDRNPNRYAQLRAITDHGSRLAVEAQSFDPQTSDSPWSDPDGVDDSWRKVV